MNDEETETFCVSKKKL